MTYDYSKLKATIIEKYRTQHIFAECMGVSYPTLGNKLNNKGSFSQYEIETICKMLNINRKKIVAYFFTEDVSQQETKKGEYEQKR